MCPRFLISGTGWQWQAFLISPCADFLRGVGTESRVSRIPTHRQRPSRRRVPDQSWRDCRSPHSVDPLVCRCLRNINADKGNNNPSTIRPTIKPRLHPSNSRARNPIHIPPIPSNAPMAPSVRPAGEARHQRCKRLGNLLDSFTPTVVPQSQATKPMPKLIPPNNNDTAPYIFDGTCRSASRGAPTK